MAKQIVSEMCSVTRRGFLGGITGIIAADFSIPTKAGSQSTADLLATMPRSIRKLVATEIGVSVETINEWLNSGQETELISDVMQRLGALFQAGEES